MVSPAAEVTCQRRTVEDEFLVLGTDGVWDVLSNQVRKNFPSGQRNYLYFLVDSSVYLTVYPQRQRSVCVCVCVCVFSFFIYPFKLFCLFSFSIWFQYIIYLFVCFPNMSFIYTVRNENNTVIY